MDFRSPPVVAFYRLVFTRDGVRVIIRVVRALMTK